MMSMQVPRLIFSLRKLIKNPDSVLCIGKVSYYYDVVSISGVEFIDKQHNNNDTMTFSIKLFEKDDSDVKLFKQLTTIVSHD